MKNCHQSKMDYYILYTSNRTIVFNWKSSYKESGRVSPDLCGAASLMCPQRKISFSNSDEAAKTYQGSLKTINRILYQSCIGLHTLLTGGEVAPEIFVRSSSHQAIPENWSSSQVFLMTLFGVFARFSFSGKMDSFQLHRATSAFSPQ